MRVQNITITTSPLNIQSGKRMKIFVVNQYDNFNEYENFCCYKSFTTQEKAINCADKLFKDLLKETNTTAYEIVGDNEYSEAIFGNDYLLVVKVEEIELEV